MIPIITKKIVQQLGACAAITEDGEIVRVNRATAGRYVADRMGNCATPFRRPTWHPVAPPSRGAGGAVHPYYRVSILSASWCADDTAQLWVGTLDAAWSAFPVMNGWTLHTWGQYDAEPRLQRPSTLYCFGMNVYGSAVGDNFSLNMGVYQMASPNDPAPILRETFTIQTSAQWEAAATSLNALPTTASAASAAIAAATFASCQTKTHASLPEGHPWLVTAIPPSPDWIWDAPANFWEISGPVPNNEVHVLRIPLN